MNGSAYSSFDTQEHILKLGETFEKHPKSAYHTVRCKWDLESVGHVWWVDRCTLVSIIAKLEHQPFGVQFVNGIVGLFPLFNRSCGCRILKAVFCHHNFVNFFETVSPPLMLQLSHFIAKLA